MMVNLYNYKGARFSRTLDTYDYADSFVYSGIHDILKFYKHGYSKVTDQACREIRFGRLTKEQAFLITSFYEMQKPDHIDLFCKWLDVDKRSLLFAANRHRNEKFWFQKEPDEWHLKKNIAKSHKPNDNLELQYPNTSDSISNEYITIGKGVDWPKKKSETDIDWL